MALLMFDGFEAYGTSTAAATQSGNWSDFNLTSIATGATSRTGGYGLNIPTAGTSWTATTANVIPAGNPSLVIGMGVHIRGLGSAPRIARLRDSAGTPACGLRYTAAGDFELVGASDALLHSFGAPTEAPTTGFASVELKVTLSTTAGTAELHVNGKILGTVGTGLNTLGTAGDVANLRFGEGSAFYCDDIYILDTSGTEHNDFLGPVRVHALAPDSDVETDWTPNAGTSHYTQVDDQTSGHDSDSTYVASSTVGARDLYGLADLAAVYQNPVAVQAYWAARHDNSSGGAGMAALLKSGATEVEGAEVPLSAGYVVRSEPIQATNPDTGAAWTPAEINALQIGAIVKSNL